MRQRDYADSGAPCAGVVARRLFERRETANIVDAVGLHRAVNVVIATRIRQHPRVDSLIGHPTTGGPIAGHVDAAARQPHLQRVPKRQRLFGAPQVLSHEVCKKDATLLDESKSGDAERRLDADGQRQADAEDDETAVMFLDGAVKS